MPKGNDTQSETSCQRHLNSIVYITAYFRAPDGASMNRCAVTFAETCVWSLFHVYFIGLYRCFCVIWETGRSLIEVTNGLRVNISLQHLLNSLNTNDLHISMMWEHTDGLRMGLGDSLRTPTACFWQLWRNINRMIWRTDAMESMSLYKWISI